MSKPKSSIDNKEQACEIIEMALNDIETLAKAFNLIAEVCEELPDSDVAIEEDKPSSLIN